MDGLLLVLTFLVLGGFALVTLACGAIHLGLAFAWMRSKDLPPEFHFPVCLLFPLVVMAAGHRPFMSEWVHGIAKAVAAFGVLSEVALLATAAGYLALTRYRRHRGN